jgi:hypothetical protein
VRRGASLALAVALALGLLTPVAWAAGSSQSLLGAPSSTSPFSPGVPQAPATVPTTTSPVTTPVTPTTTAATSSGGSFGTGSAIAVALGAVIVIGGISYFIWRDARRRAPARGNVASLSATAGGRGRPGSKRPPKPRKLSPAQRRQRKRGRARPR